MNKPYKPRTKVKMNTETRIHKSKRDKESKPKYKKEYKLGESN